jgi:beta-galactosidase beta subunit
MILSRNLNDLLPHVKNPGHIQAIKDYLAAGVDIEKSKHGDKTTVTGDVTVVFLSAEGTGDNMNLLEAHRKFMDLHCTLQGTDVIAYKPVADCGVVQKAYDEAGDYILFTDTPGKQLQVEPGSYCLIPTSFAHMALYGKCGPVKKLVFKIPC